MKGFKEFLMRGNLVDLAVAVVIGGAFGAVVSALVDIILDLAGRAGGVDSFSNVAVGGVHLGPFLSALITFLIVAAVVYFAVVLPYNKLRERFEKEQEEEGPTSEELLAEIRDLLRERT